ncbi:DUF4832 domain-containing protein [Mucilaginibacter daejeonensis]|uniref:DUF4832 domain-containing protein n=1 Tax=Mucilaginibacter daejeonensis TaxID=398049 RepID=UPI001D17486F|nr:DUF4832 domain-containing protein [Mucilaginibacter daejeonensis]UEG51656.1 DUF4832 domain-containing protein [Mucilaginibacter daejeonensis]
MRRSQKRPMLLNVLAALLCVLSISCKKDAETDTSAISGTLVKPNYNRSTVFRNPLNGWVMYAGADDEKYWDNTYYVPDLGKTVKAIDYASACYVRTSWAKLNPSDGVYAWREPNSGLGKLIRGAASRGVPIAFRIVVDGRDQGLNTPQFVFDAGAKYYLENSSFPQRRTPYPQDAIFRKYYAKFITELAKDFNDPQKTAFIDAYGLGKWGEAHNVIYEEIGAAVSANTEKLKEEAFDWVTDLYSQNFTKVPLVINYHRLVGHPASWGAANVNSDRLLVKAINKGYSLRQDAFGMTDYYQSWERAFAKTWNFKRPIIMEGGWITTGTHSYWTDPSKKYRQDHPEDVRQGEFDTSLEAAVNMMDFRVGEIDSWFTKSFSLVQRFTSEGGYRLYPDQVYLPDNLISGEEATITHRWRNMGWGYFPNNIPQWNYKYKVAFALLDASGAVKKILVDDKAEPSTWLKNAPSRYELKAGVTLPAGTYTWAVAIVDTQKDNKPGIKLAVNGDMTAEGWLKLMNVQIK